MDFISNLIKRPKSLVLSDSRDQANGNINPSANPDNPCSSNSIKKKANNSAHNPRSGIMKTNRGNASSGIKKLPVVVSPTQSVLADFHACGDSASAANYESERRQSHSSTRRKPKAADIEKYLLNIRENLDRASRADGVDEPEFRANKYASNLVLNPLGLKSTSTNKSHSSLFEPCSSVNKSRANSESESGCFSEPQLMSNNNITDLIKNRKFTSLTEFGESKTCELPKNFNPNTDQIKFTFEENLIPTLTANANTRLYSTSPSDDNPKMLQLLNNETDTAVSSDNETYAECQPFSDLLNINPGMISNDLGCGDASDAETYRSALTSYSNTALSARVGDEQNFDATMENVEDICDEEFNASAREIKDEQSCLDKPTPSSDSTNKYTLIADVGNAQFDNECEPMDVSMVDIQEEPKMQDINVEAICAPGVNNEVEPKSSKNRLTFSIENLSPCTPKQAEHTEKLNTDDLQSAVASEKETLKPQSTLLDHPEKAAAQHLTSSSSTEKFDSLSPCYSSGIPKENLGVEVLETREPTKPNRLTFSLKADEQSVSGDDQLATVGAPPEEVGSAAILGALEAEPPRNRLTFSAETAKQQQSLGNTVPATSNCSNAGKNNTCDLIQDSNVDSATDIMPPNFPVENCEHLQAAAHSFIAENGGVATEITSTDSERAASFEKSLTSSQSSLGSVANFSDAKMNSSSGALSKTSSSVHSFTFPMKSTAKSNKFPQSPNANKSSIFLEKSDYIANKDSKEATPSKSAAKEENLSSASSVEHNSDEAINKTSGANTAHPPTAVATKSGSHRQTALDCTFDGANSLPSPLMTSSGNEIPAESIDKRRNFNVSPTPSTQTNSLNLTRDTSRDTLNITHSAGSGGFNESLEAMDVDCLMRATTAPHTPSSNQQANTNSTFASLTNSAVGMEVLSAKEQTKSNSKDEKDVFVENVVPFANENAEGNSTCSFAVADSSQKPFDFSGEEFTNNFILNPSDFDYLLTKGNNNVQIDRSSLLLRFDPLLGVPVPVNQPQKQPQHLQQLLANNNLPGLSPTLEEDEQQNEGNRSLDTICCNNKTATTSKKSEVHTKANERSTVGDSDSVQCKKQQQQQKLPQDHTKSKRNARMSVDVIKDMKLDNDCNKSGESLNTQTDEIRNNCKIDELEKRLKNEVLKNEDIEKKLKEAEQREEALIKRITEKDKTVSKMNGVIEAYEKAIAELISEKEQIIMNYEKQLVEVKADRDSNYHHLTSLETTFSDLHVKYEKSKEMTLQLKSIEESLLTERKSILESLRLQEQRYEKMKNHAMQQLEIANKKLESMTKEHAVEVTKLKASLKKEEISRASINEQLQQKTRENSELVKICDELISGQGS